MSSGTSQNGSGSLLSGRSRASPGLVRASCEVEVLGLSGGLGWLDVPPWLGMDSWERCCDSSSSSEEIALVEGLIGEELSRAFLASGCEEGWSSFFGVGGGWRRRRPFLEGILKGEGKKIIRMIRECWNCDFWL